MNINKNIGSWGEFYVARLYLARGYKLLVKNSFNRKGKQLGEIDLILSRKNVLVFVEVKTRVSGKYGYPEESVTYQKQQRIIKAVQWFLNSHSEFQNFQPRIDVCAILLLESAKFCFAPDLDKFVKYSKIITNAVELN